MKLRNEKHFWKNGIEIAPKTEVNYLRAFSYNELELLYQLTGFKNLAVYGAMDVHSVIENQNYVEKLTKPYESYVFILRKPPGSEKT